MSSPGETWRPQRFGRTIFGGERRPAGASLRLTPLRGTVIDRNADQFREWLRQQLRARRMSLRQLAALSGVSASTVSRVVRGDRQPSLQTALRMANVLRMPNDEFDPGTQLGVMVNRVDHATEVERALRADANLAEADVRRIMLMYHALRRAEAGKRTAEHRSAS
jgi:transcriptional regulator with XRE-family HTH domain